MPTNRVPKYRLHRASGQAVVTLAGRDHYLGPYGSAESRAKYDRLIAEWFARGRIDAPTARRSLSVAAVADAYLQFAEGYYVKDGRPTSHVERIRRVLKVVCRLYGDVPARDFGPLALKAVREEMIRMGWARKPINSYVGSVKACFGWAVSEELIPPEVFQALKTVVGLRAGKTAAAETSRVLPVPPEHVPPVLPFLTPVLRSVVLFQLYSGCRPGEALAVRPRDVDRSGDVWEYRPESHKTAHHGHARVIFLGPKAQAVLAPYLDRDPDSYCFSARESMDQYLASIRKRPGVNVAARQRAKQPGARYRTTSYAAAVRRACLDAGVPPWHPHRLRHSAATLLRAEFGLDTARTVLGHRNLQVTEIYAESDLAKAKEAMRKLG